MTGMVLLLLSGSSLLNLISLCGGGEVLGITHLRHISLVTPVLKEQADFYEKIWGLDKVSQYDHSVYFRGAGPENHILS